MPFTPSKKKAQSYGDFYKSNSRTGLGAQVGSDQKMPPWAKKSDSSGPFRNGNPFKKNDEEEEDDSLDARKRAIQRRLKRARKA